MIASLPQLGGSRLPYTLYMLLQIGPLTQALCLNYYHRSPRPFLALRMLPVVRWLLLSSWSNHSAQCIEDSSTSWQTSVHMIVEQLALWHDPKPLGDDGSLWLTVFAYIINKSIPNSSVLWVHIDMHDAYRSHLVAMVLALITNLAVQTCRTKTT